MNQKENPDQEKSTEESFKETIEKLIWKGKSIKPKGES